ncbi:MAG: hypothetical protein KDI68_08430 [Gammaproteobacteria bacterium]|nr:hypothetical protein [Gammaproteobacteria bacterium]
MAPWLSGPPHGAITIFCRSDATPNPSALQICTAEFDHRSGQCDEVVESMHLALDWDDGTRVILLPARQPGPTLDDDRDRNTRTTTEVNRSPRHLPSRIIQVVATARARSDRIDERAVREAVHDRQLNTEQALADPPMPELCRYCPALQVRPDRTSIDPTLAEAAAERGPKKNRGTPNVAHLSAQQSSNTACRRGW